MRNIFEFIASVANQRVDSGKPMGIPALTALANAAGFRSKKGQPYCVGGRGFYRVVSDAYACMHGSGDPGAWKILEFQDSNGNYRWKKR